MRTAALLALISAGGLCGQSTEYLYALHSGGVSGFSINPKNGRHKKLPGSPFSLTGIYRAATFAPGGAFLYISANEKLNLIHAFAISATTGALSEVPGSPFPETGTGPLAVDASGRFLYARDSQGNVEEFTIDAALGALTPVGQTGIAIEGAFLADPQSPYLFTYAFAAYAIDPQTGSLTLASSNGTPPGAFGENAQGTALYNVNGGSMFVSSFDAATGILSPVAGSPFTVLPYENGTLVVDPFDRFLYIMEDTGKYYALSGYLLDAASGGLLTHVGNWKLAGTPSNALAVDPSGRFLYVGQVAKTIATYKVNQKSGVLTPSAVQPLRVDAEPLQLFALAPSSPALPQLSAIQITPPSVSLVSSATAQTAQFTAVGQYVDGSTRFLTASTTWSSSNTSFANIANSPGSAGLASTTGAGTATITAQFDGLTATASLTVSAPSLASIAVTPADPTLTAGTSIHFTATGTYTDGSTQNLTKACAWSSSDTSVATVGGPGHVSTLAPGSSTISATDGSVTATAVLTVQ